MGGRTNKHALLHEVTQESVIRALAKGDGAEEIWLRKRDEFYELAEAINSLIKSMKR